MHSHTQCQCHKLYGMQGSITSLTLAIRNAYYLFHVCKCKGEAHLRNWIPPLTGMDREIILFEIIGKVNKLLFTYIPVLWRVGTSVLNRLIKIRILHQEESTVNHQTGYWMSFRLAEPYGTENDLFKDDFESICQMIVSPIFLYGKNTDQSHQYEQLHFKPVFLYLIFLHV